MISLIIPFYNEEDNVDPVLSEIRTILPDAEIVAIDDGSMDGTNAALQSRIRSHADIVLIEFERNRGKGFAVHEGLLRAKNESCVLVDGDGQYDPADILPLASRLAEADLVCGSRVDRKDARNARVVSRIANAIRRMVLHDGIRDSACGLKAIRRSVAVRHLFPFEGLHRFIPAIFHHADLAIVEVPIKHRPRLHGVTKYTHFGRAKRGIVDLFRVKMLLKKVTLAKA
ncbi:glycosyltransferase family 2 protein [Candidatus Parcubacteria bacterium]|nr:glycosyltransferase family 2 protein [Candidatus Parcubacteria bacterium]